MPSILCNTLDALTRVDRYMSIAVSGEASVYDDVIAWLAVRLGSVEHPDIIHLVGKDDASVHIDDVRRLVERLSIYPFSGSYYVLIPHAHMLSKHCMNALLKALEEPVRTWFFLITPHIHLLSDTIRSRCVVAHSMQVSVVHNTLQDDLKTLMHSHMPLSISSVWCDKTSSATEWLTLLWSATSALMLSQEYRASITTKRYGAALVFLDDILFLLRVQGQSGALHHKRCVERSLIAWSSLYFSH